ncbi:MAG: hypothetical protein V4622_00655 [Bacteroidota bacterium]
MKRCLFFFILLIMIISSCKKEEESDLPFGYYDFIINPDSTYSQTFYLKKFDSAEIGNEDSKKTKDIYFEHEVNSVKTYSFLKVDEEKNITSGELNINGNFYNLKGYWYFEEQTTTYYIKGTYNELYYPNSTGNFIISKKIE